MSTTVNIIRNINVRDELSKSEWNALNALLCKNNTTLAQLAGEWKISYFRLYNPANGRSGSSPIVRYLLRKYLIENGYEIGSLTLQQEGQA